MAGALLLMAGGCSDSDDWTPGPQDTETGVSAYFPAPAQTSYIFDPANGAENMNIRVVISRQHTDQAASVPLSLESDHEGFSIPQTVEFAAGESETTFEINCGGIPDGSSEVTVTIDPSQSDIYGDGLYAVTYSVVRAQWVVIADNVTYHYNNEYPETTSVMYNLEGTNQFRLEDWFGSGLSITFTASDPTLSVIYPVANALYVDGYPDEWELYDEANVTYPQWIPGNVEGGNAITYMYVYGSGYYKNNMLSNPDTGYGYLMPYFYLEFADGTSGYKANTWYVDFNLKYNPFE